MCKTQWSACRAHTKSRRAQLDTAIVKGSYKCHAEWERLLDCNCISTQEHSNDLLPIPEDQE